MFSLSSGGLQGKQVVGNQLEQEIIALYNDDITASYSINQIATKLDKSYPYINKKVNNLIDENILKKTEVGRSHLCTINLENDQAIWLLVLNDTEEKKELIQENQDVKKVTERLKELKQAITLHLVLKTNNHLAIVVEGQDDKEVLEKSTTLPIENDTYTTEEFQKEILEDEQIIKDHTILYGYEKYYQFIREVKGQLRIQYSPLLQ